jgi:hypothetical protein
MEQAPDIRGAETEPRISGLEQAQHVAMGQQRALRLPVEPEV